jgi:hypothetical protein
MINDYVWTQLYAQREAQLRAQARRRGGAPASSTRPGSGYGGWRWLRLRRHPVAAPTRAVAEATAGQARSRPAHGAAGAGTTTLRPHAPTKEAA